ncbi:GNAT family N-acetyltransferase [Mucilaginibacter sp. UR6-11]|uniref:GNAT family N-acetyltransferase n=1 Tax=Mucilaginibacter sp. UR6-11 TaxID=1435644 RepID=UPI001E56DF60|nr:GNAT family protein [Mucilaginibacter sp. UR6-11]MCC8426360.1 GNAT family N-acetyltransferase [Mucilaginibacter sp. UR6-11]
MIISIYIRPLVLEDAKISYLWRNDPSIWTYTGFKANGIITEEMETEWLRNNLNRPDQSRFAICVKRLDTYIGNVQLLDFHGKTAELHLFIGNKLYWGKGVGFQATVLILRYGFFNRKLEVIYLKVHPANIAAISIYEKAGFQITGKDDGNIIMSISFDRFSELEPSFKVDND